MISMFAGLILQGLVQAEARPAPPPPPPPPPPGRLTPVRARANLATLLSSDDYPLEALRKGEQGTVSLRLQVGANGRVAGCTITRSSGSAILDSTTCRLLTARARFTPARDARGRPVADSLSSRIVWRIPDPLIPMESRSLVAQVGVTPAGAVTCSISVNNRAVSPVSCDAPPGLAEAARASGKWTQQTMYERISLVGEAPAMVPADWGERLTSSEAKLRVAADGSIVGCWATRNDQLEAGVKARILAADPCKAWPVGSRKFEPGPEGGPARDVTVRTSLYRR